ncbi:MAG: DUF11 domain-containing protein [Actinomycetia bacterium]|nr:DUF11 domain-containing protein [Actinomycetes bacterium]
MVFITDGDPSAATSNGKSNQGIDPPPHVPDYLIKLDRSDGQDYSFWKGINAANDLKSSGRNPRLLAVGVGKALNNSSSLNRLKAVAGPDVYDGNGDFDINVDDVTTVRDFNKLGESLKKVATELCSPSVTITKLAQTADSAQYVPAAGWDMRVNPTVPSGTYTWTQPDKGDPPGPKTLSTDNNGQAQFQWEPSGSVTSTAQISETSRSGYTFNSASCRRLDDGVPSNDPPFVNGSATFTSKDFNIPVGPEAIVTCEYRNSFNYAPGISLTKRATDDPVRGNANGWNQTYTFEVKNTGNAPLNGVAVSDSKCQSISGPSGDTNQDGWLDQAETWTYTCARKISHPTTDQDVTAPNTADVIAVDPNKTPVSATAQVSVSVKTPAIKVDKVAKRPNGTVIDPTDEIPAGSLVTYEYTVTNTGNDTLQDIQISDDKCATLVRTSGTGTQLATTDTWVYECTTALQPPSTEAVVRNTVTVSGLWSNPQSRTQNNGRVTDTDVAEVRVKKSATINVVKQVTTGQGSQDFEFTATSTDGNVPAADASFNLNPDGSPSTSTRSIVVEPAPGGSDYVITEIGNPGPAGWELTNLTCTLSAGGSESTNVGTGVADLTLSAGDAATCVYSNEKLAALSVTKIAPGDAETFNFTANHNPGSISPGNFDLDDGQSQSFVDLEPGTVTITETPIPGGWALSQISCGTHPVAANIGAGTAEIDLAYGDDVHCTFTNRQTTGAASLTVNKIANPADGTDFAFTADGANGGVPPSDQSFDLSPNGGPASLTIPITPQVGGEVFTIAEVLTPEQALEWTLEDISCVINGSPAGTRTGDAVELTISPDEKVVCTFSNKDAASLTVAKAAPAGGSLSFPFSWSVTSPGLFDLTNASFASTFPLDSGSYRVDELTSSAAFPTDWYLAAGRPFCNGTAAPPAYSGSGVDINVAPGEDAFCLFVNFYDYQPAIQLVKTVDRTQILDTSGTAAQYTYTVTNTGNEIVTPVGSVNDMVVDDECSPVTRVSGSGTELAVGDSWVFECSMTPGTDVTNTAVATMQGLISTEKVTSTDQQTVSLLEPELEINKTGDTDTVYAGDTVTYSYEVRSTGPTPFENPSLSSRDEWVTDDKCSPVTYVSGDINNDDVLDTNEVWRFTCATAVSSDTTNTGSVTATPFLATSPQSGAKQVGTPLTRTDTFAVKVITPGIAITKAAAAPEGDMIGDTLLVPAGTNVTFTYEVTTGAADTPMRAIGVTDDKCAPVTYKSGDTNKNGLIDTDETWTYTCDQLFALPQPVTTNTGSIIAVEPILGQQLTATAQAKVQAYAEQINIEKSTDTGIVAVGDRVTYRYEVTNPGYPPLSDIVVTDNRCDPVEYQKGDTNGDGKLQPDETWSYACVTNLSETTTNTATVTGRPPHGGTVTDISTAVVKTLDPAKAGIAVTKKASSTSVKKGSAVTYTYKVRNTGSIALDEVELTDDKCTNPKYVRGDDDGNGLLTSGKEREEYSKEVWTYTCTQTIDTKTVNTAIATAQPEAQGHRIGARISDNDNAVVKVPGGGGNNPAITGAQILGWLMAGILLLVAGAVLRRRRQS